LEHRVDRFGHVGRHVAHGQRAGVLQVVEAREPEAPGAAEPGPAGREGQRIAEREPGQRHHRGDGDHAGHGGEHVLAPHHAGIEERDARQRHQQHQHRGGHHPRGVRGADGGLRYQGHGGGLFLEWWSRALCTSRATSLTA
uniref:Nitrite reductase n=1 Tax=Brugia timori TaxID=42155 RepID=A0A0R3QJB4_9BILA